MCQLISSLVYEPLDLKEKYVGLDCFLKLDFVGTSLVIPVVKTSCSQHEDYSLDSLVRELKSRMPQSGAKNKFLKNPLIKRNKVDFVVCCFLHYTV